MEQFSFSWLVYIVMLLMIAFSKLHKSVITMSAGVIFFISRYVTIADVANYNMINLDFILSILGMSIIASFMKYSGFFQFLVLKAVRISDWNYKKLVRNICVVILILSSFFCDRIAVVLIFPIVAFIYDSLNLEFNNTIIGILNSASIGGTMLAISGAEVMLVATFANISFLEYFMNITPALLVAFFIYMIFVQKNAGAEELIDTTTVSIIKFNEDMALAGPNLFSKLLLVMLSTILILFFSAIMGLSDSVIIITGSILLFLVIELPPDKILKEIKLNLYLYILGLQIVSTAFYKYHIYEVMAAHIVKAFALNGYYISILILASGFVLSIVFGRLSMTFLYIPIISIFGTMGLATMPLYSAFVFSMTFARAPTMMREIPKVLKNTHIEEKRVWEHNVKLLKDSALMYITCFLWFAFYLYVKFYLK